MIAARQIELVFGAESRAAETHVNLSAVRHDGPCLWLAGDETATIERLTEVRGPDGHVTGYSGQVTYRLADFVELPAGPDEEADLEGLASGDGWLWAVGSHSLKRKRVKPEHSPAKSRRRLGTLVREENRYILVRIPLEVGPDGLPTPVREAVDGRRAEVLGGRGDSLAEVLADDPHLGPFFAIPSKDNGVDVEGVALHGDRIYVGFRGPVLRGWAALVEIWPESDPAAPGRMRLRALNGARYHSHFLDLDGLGIRDLCPEGDDLLVLAGPSMALSGPVRLYRWPDAVRASAPAFVADLERLGDLPHGQGEDHAEGIALVDGSLLVVYDSPAPTRHTPNDGMLADLFPWP
ncbi:DUF3616 domain-containing protein [Actinocorallia sp. A-T 12471]|uniref:DUF3616 domain-containing protein n=1 Tax=Actinocorallia sp. A-T 12471 TaxID=3089813 RepID=UPI0029D3375A|nr:DUF3616 domain-containing protein [Actinocorallia sp. A-T 12471]MDX6744767.1 DUF3616 domain-containing protein [Actinocorallia sp. A-T 12471]